MCPNEAVRSHVNNWFARLHHSDCLHDRFPRLSLPTTTVQPAVLSKSSPFDQKIQRDNAKSVRWRDICSSKGFPPGDILELVRCTIDRVKLLAYDCASKATHQKYRIPTRYFHRDDCEEQVKGFPGAKHKKFKNPEEASKWLSTNGVNLDTMIQGSANAAASSSSVRMDPLARPSPKPDATKGKAKNTSKPLVGQITDTTHWQIVYSDGACRGNGKPGSIAGVGVWWGPNDPR